jgi:ribosomal protein S12 methylthiotransferase
MTKKNRNKLENKQVTVLTLGCAKNIVDSERLLGLLKKHKIRISYDIDNTDTLIINTCGFIKPAKKESIDTIMEAVGMKEQGLLEEIIVIGCLSERYKNELREQIPAVDDFFGVEQYQDIINFLVGGNDKILLTKRELLTPNHFAYLKIAEGCNHSCGFCAIPLIKGKYRSIAQKDALKEAKYLVSKGVKEINIIAQDTTYYGVDLDGNRQISKLMDALAKNTNAQWLRLMYTYPTGFPLDLLDVINRHDNICNYIDIPFQHISDRILKKMRRAISKSSTLSLLEEIRKRIENVAIRSAFIVGFPGETEEEFSELYNFIEDQKLDRVGVFVYSHEESTPAYQFDDDIPEQEKELRRDELMKLQSRISLEKNEQKIGSIQKVLVDGIDERGQYFGRTQHDAPDVDNAVIITSSIELEIGSFADVKITEADNYDLFGEALL